jgi:hypothetical protein
VATERTAQEDHDERRERSMVVVERAINDLASWKVAAATGLNDEVCEQWVNAVWDGLRDNLDPEDRLFAILGLINDTAQARARALLREPSLRGFGAVDHEHEVS